MVELEDTARSADDAAKALGVPVGAIVKTLLFVIISEAIETPVIVLVSGDRQCDTASLAPCLGITGKVSRPDANQVKAMTEEAVPLEACPIGLLDDLNILMDASLARFDIIWSAAGHPHCVFSSTYERALLSGPGQPTTDRTPLTGS